MEKWTSVTSEVKPEGSKSDCVFPVRFGIKPDLFYYSHIGVAKRQVRFSFLFFCWNAHVCLPLTCSRRRMLIWLLINDMEPLLRRMSRRSIFHFPRRENASMHTPTRVRTHTHTQNIQPHIRTHAVALRPWKTADTSGQTRRRSVCGAAERFGSDSSCDGSSPPKGVETAVASKLAR